MVLHGRVQGPIAKEANYTNSALLNKDRNTLLIVYVYTYTHLAT